MKKSLYISITFILVLFFTLLLGFANHKKSNISVRSSENQISFKVSNSVQQHDLLFITSIAENDFDADKTFFELPFVLFEKEMFSWGSALHSNMVMNSETELIHHYHLPKYLLFHNLKLYAINTAL
ncbi:hypothetical protein [Chryseobacterium sp. MYb328]|uniref:hypothetical protein n=1 Tax=Chryseobacterium sp. MYb328 TaxID=2745231 RepID=UPI0030B0606E